MSGSEGMWLVKHQDDPRLSYRARVFARLPAYAISVVAVVISIGMAFLMHRFMPNTSLTLMFLTVVLFVAARTGLGPSLLASVLSFLALNYFFTDPQFTFEVADREDVITLLFFLLIAAITGHLAARMKEEIVKRRTSLERISKLYEFSREIGSTARFEEVLQALGEHVSRSLAVPSAVFTFRSDGEVELAGSTYAGVIPNHQQLKAAWEKRDESTQGFSEWHFITLASPDRPIGLLAMNGKLGDEQTDLARNMCEQAALALDRTRLAGDLEEARLVSETEQLRSALLSSVSHDLRTPLASIIGSSTSLLEYGKSFSEENRQELLATIAEEARRLDRHIQNLLDMTRLGRGRLTLKRDWVDLHDVVAGALERLKESIKTVSVEITIEPSVPLLWIHGALLEQAIVNILDNAILFSEPGGRIRFGARLVSEAVEIEIQDEGPGIPEAEREKVFDMFYTLRQGDRIHTQGTGLGLAICRGMIGAHGGGVTALEGPDGIGTCMRIVLPLTLPAKAIPA